MISALGGFCLGAAVTMVGWLAMRGVFEGYVFQRTNYRDHRLPTAAGAVVCLGACAVVATYAVLGGVWQSLAGPTGWLALRVHGPTLCALVLGFGFLGLLDDLGGSGEHGGFRSHFGSLARGRLTTGAVKALGGPVVVLALPHPYASEIVPLLRGAAIICLSANLVNLFDRAPGRAVKVGLLWFAVEVVAFRSSVLGAVGLVTGGSAALLPEDLREALMIGDTGANVIGAALGYGIVVSAGSAVAWTALALLAALNLVSEFVSFSRVIQRVRVLSWFDLLGATRRRP